MLTMVNGEHQVSPPTASGAAAVATATGDGLHHHHHHHHQPLHSLLSLHQFAHVAMNDENAAPRQRNIPVPVLVKHEEYGLSTITSALSGDESSTSFQSATATSHDGVGTSSGGSKRVREKRSTKSKCPPGLRSGKWTPEEEAFTNMLIYYFKLGRLHVEDGTSLRWYLAKRLNCEAMRVTKKLKGNSSIGKQIFRALEDTDENRRATAAAAVELAVVEKAFTDSLVATGQPTPSTSGQASSGPRTKRVSPHKSMAVPTASHLDTQNLVIPKVRDSLANSEDARLLMHFFVGAHDATSLDDDVASPATATAAPSAHGEKKRLFSDVDTSPSTASSSSQADSPDSKRRSMQMDDLVRTV